MSSLDRDVYERDIVKIQQIANILEGMSLALELRDADDHGLYSYGRDIRNASYHYKQLLEEIDNDKRLDNDNV